MTLLRYIDRGLQKVEWGLLQCAKLSLVLMALLITANAMGRYFFQNPITGARAITAELLMILLVYLALVPLFTDGDHVRLTILYNRYPPFIRSFLELLFDLMALLFFAIITYEFWTSFLHRYEIGILPTAGFSIPRMIPYFIIFAGCLVLCFRFVVDVVRQLAFLSGLSRGDDPNAPPDASTEDDE